LIFYLINSGLNKRFEYLNIGRSGGIMNSKFKIIGILIFILLASALTAQGHLTSKRLALGYSFSTISTNNTVYGLNTFGLTIAGKIDFYHGFSRVNSRDYSVTGITVYMRKYVNQKIFPAISGTLMSYEERGGNSINPAASLGLYYKVIDNNNFKLFAVPTFSVVSVSTTHYSYYGNHTTRDAELFGGLFLSASINTTEYFAIYLEPEITFDSRVNPSIEIGLSYQFGRNLAKN